MHTGGIWRWGYKVPPYKPCVTPRSQALPLNNFNSCSTRRELTLHSTIDILLTIIIHTCTPEAKQYFHCCDVMCILTTISTYMCGTLPLAQARPKMLCIYTSYSGPRIGGTDMESWHAEFWPLYTDSFHHYMWETITRLLVERVRNKSMEKNLGSSRDSNPRPSKY